MKFLQRSIILISSYFIALYGYDLSPSEMRGYFVCDDTKTGVSIWSFPIAYSVNLSHTLGEKNIVSTSNGGKTLEWKIYGINKDPQLIINLEKIDSGEYESDNISCYQVEKIFNKKNNFLIEKKDLTPEMMAQMAIFGWPVGSKEDKRQEKRIEKLQEIKQIENVKNNDLKDKREKEQETNRIKELEHQKYTLINILDNFLDKSGVKDLIVKRKCIFDCELKKIILDKIFLSNVIYTSNQLEQSGYKDIDEMKLISEEIKYFLDQSAHQDEIKLLKAQAKILDKISQFNYHIRNDIERRFSLPRNYQKKY